MPEPKSLRESLEEVFRNRGINLDTTLAAPIDTSDDVGKQEHIRLAMAYADENIPTRYADAIAGDPDVVAWVEQLAELAAASANGAVLRRGPSIRLMGATGVGKTYQAYGAFRLLATFGVRARWIGVSAADLYARLRPRHGVDSETEFRAVADAPLLLVDDLGAAKTSEWVEEVNFRLVNWRYERELPTVFTSNVPPKELSAALGERVASRLVEMTGRVSLKGEDRRRVTT